MASEFYLTGMGHKFYERDVPRISRSLERIAAALEQFNAREQARLSPGHTDLMVTPESLEALLHERPVSPTDPTMLKETK